MSDVSDVKRVFGDSLHRATSLSIACVQSVIATDMVKAKEFYVDALGLKMTKERRGTVNEKL